MSCSETWPLRYRLIKGKLIDTEWLYQLIGARIMAANVRVSRDPNVEATVDMELFELARDARDELLNLE